MQVIRYAKGILRPTSLSDHVQTDELGRETIRRCTLEMCPEKRSCLTHFHEAGCTFTHPEVSMQLTGSGRLEVSRDQLLSGQRVAARDLNKIRERRPGGSVDEHELKKAIGQGRHGSGEHIRSAIAKEKCAKEVTTLRDPSERIFGEEQNRDSSAAVA